MYNIRIKGAAMSSMALMLWGILTAFGLVKPVPVTMLANIRIIADSSKYHIRRSELMLADTLSIRMQENPAKSLDSNYVIRTFKVLVVPEGGEPSEFICYHNKIPLQAKLLFSKLKPNSVIVIESIHVYNTRVQQEQVLMPVVFYVAL